MLLINQRLDKLSAMRCDFAARGMLPAGHAEGGQISHILRPLRSTHDSEEDHDSEPVEGPGQEVLGLVILAKTRGTSTAPLTDKSMPIKA
jgi:hypothetical protein